MPTPLVIDRSVPSGNSACSDTPSADAAVRDGALSLAEGHLARRVGELLGFQHPEVQAVREKVKLGA